MITQETQNFVHQGQRFGVTQRVEMEEAGCPFIFAGAKSNDQMIIQGRAFVVDQ